MLQVSGKKGVFRVLLILFHFEILRYISKLIGTLRTQNSDHKLRRSSK